MQMTTGNSIFTTRYALFRLRTRSPHDTLNGPTMFLAPLFLFGLATAAIPLLLHLRRSTRVKKITFSTTRFFDEQFIRSSRRARFPGPAPDRLPAHRPARALRARASSPAAAQFPGMAAAAGGRRNVAIVLDDSASMGLINDKGTLLDRAKRRGPRWRCSTRSRWCGRPRDAGAGRGAGRG